MGAMGLKVAFKKGERANSLQWIGVKFSIVNSSKAVLTLPDKFMAELKATLQSWSNKGYAPLKELRTATGRLSWLSGVLPMARWVTAAFYAVLYSTEEEDTTRTGRHRGLFPVKRLEQARLWLIEFLDKSLGNPQRSFSLLQNELSPVTITTDASPTALGAILAVQGAAIAAISSPVTTADARMLRFAKGQSSSQGVVEALAIYVAIRTWKDKLKGRSVQLTIQSDSITALALTQRLSNSSPGLNFLGAELGILLEELEIEKVHPRHIPGMVNTAADYLSRPEKWEATELPVGVQGLKIQATAERDDKFWYLPTPQQEPDLWGKSASLPGSRPVRGGGRMEAIPGDSWQPPRSVRHFRSQLFAGRPRSTAPFSRLQTSRLLGRAPRRAVSPTRLHLRMGHSSVPQWQTPCLRAVPVRGHAGTKPPVSSEMASTPLARGLWHKTRLRSHFHLQLSAQRWPLWPSIGAT